ncbi:hypothetical protein AB1Y20_013763 [Prymnesium parvum]|uniref:Uncharacterized protein n=1 Tax=Prymnesium parvum TaxID=97485 RepID=A0AB34IDV3_PRYPA
MLHHFALGLPLLLAFAASAGSPPRAAFSTLASFPPRAAFSASASSSPPVAFSAPAAVAARAAHSLGGEQVHVEQRWVSAGGVSLLRGATTALMGELARCSRHGTNGITLCARGVTASARAAAIGGRTVDLGVRQCRSVDLLDAEVWHRLEPCVDSLIAAMEELRKQLAFATGRPLLGEVELQLLAYPSVVGWFLVERTR